MISRSRCAIFASGICFFACQAALAEPDYWDPRLDQICMLDLIDVAAQVPAGQGYWRLISAEFRNEAEAGGQQNIYIKVLRENGSAIEGQPIYQAWPYGNVTVGVCPVPDPGTAEYACAETKGAVDGYLGNFAMWGGNCPPNNCGWPYSAFVSETASPTGLIGLSDKVIGMGLHNPQGTPCNAHVVYILTYQWTTTGPPPPATISRSPSSFSRTVTQGDNLSNNSFTLSNTGGSTLNYTITDNASWLSESPATGSIAAGGNAQISIIYSVASLGLGNHSATITITDPAATNSPQYVSVSVTVEPPTVPGDGDGDGDVDQTDFGLFQICFTGSGYPQTAPACLFAKMDGDVDVDLEDFLIFEGCMSGPELLGSVDCDQPGT